MKRILSLILAAAASLSLTACSGKTTGSSESSAAQSIEQTVPYSSADHEVTEITSQDSAEITSEVSSEPTREVTAAPQQETSQPEPAASIAENEETTTSEKPDETSAISEDGSYSSRDEVALYIHTYGHLPDNFITKKQARELGWDGGSVEVYAPGKCIGGDRFGNYEGLLPEKDGRSYTECDIDTLGKSSRGAKRIIFSNDGLIYYTDDHYASFTLLYGEE
ncbi:MAG: ribonuclease domain-containing protein [Oscillospiraceae bacterium]|nr:ribonuclease domain-containing protein [Oscillospiraceae bacterium]